MTMNLRTERRVEMRRNRIFTVEIAAANHTRKTVRPTVPDTESVDDRAIAHIVAAVQLSGR